MSRSKGWIKLYRQLTDNWIWNDPDKFRAWIDILLMVNHEDREIEFNGHVITIHAGQKLTSLKKLADRWGWTRNRVDRFLGTLSETGMVTANRTPNGTVLTVVNWEVYQGERDSKRDSKRASNEATHEAQTRMYKNDKESIRTRARGRASKIKPQERDYDMDALELKLRATNNNV